MYPFLESVKLSEGEIFNWELHKERMVSSLQFRFGEEHVIRDIQNTLYERPMQGLYKVRIEYDHHHFNLDYSPYLLRNITKLHLVHDDKITYPYKFTDRTSFNDLVRHCAPDEDILIIKNGLLTDTSYSNVALNDGERWYTPASPLLKGIKRQFLINNQMLVEKKILEKDIRRYKKIALINAMIDLEELSLPTNSIVTFNK